MCARVCSAACVDTWSNSCVVSASMLRRVVTGTTLPAMIAPVTTISSGITTTSENRYEIEGLERVMVVTGRW